MGTNVLAPRPLDPLRPSLRVYGGFETREEAVEHAELVASVDGTCSLAVVPLREWFLLPQNEQCRDDPEYRQQKTVARVQEWERQRLERDAAFDRRLQERSGTEDVVSAPPEEEDEETVEAEELVYKPPKRIRAGVEVRGHAYMALSVIPDPVVGQCVVKIYGFFESLADADRWNRNVGSRVVTDHDIHTAPTCEWLYPNGKITCAQHYRNPELQRIMDAAERNPQAVKDYKTWKAEQDRLADEERLAAQEGTPNQEAGTVDAMET